MGQDLTHLVGLNVDKIVKPPATAKVGITNGRAEITTPAQILVGLSQPPPPPVLLPRISGPLIYRDLRVRGVHHHVPTPPPPGHDPLHPPATTTFSTEVPLLKLMLPLLQLLLLVDTMAMHTMTLTPPDSDWYMDTNATSHMTQS